MATLQLNSRLKSWFSQIDIETKVSMILIAPTLLSFAVLVGALLLKQSLNQSTQWVSHTEEVMLQIADSKFHFNNLSLYHLRYQLSAEQGYLKLYDRAYLGLNQSMVKLTTLMSDSQQQQGELEKLLQLIGDRTSSHRKLISLRGTLTPDEVIKAAQAKTLIFDDAEILGLFDSMLATEAALLKSRRASEHDYYLKLEAALIVLFIIIASSLLFADRFLRRDMRLKADLHASLSESHHKLQQELAEARNTLVALLPVPATLCNVQFEWFFEASNHVGGDIMDYFQVDEHHVMFYAVDVSGHGVTAAMHAFTVHNDMLASTAHIAELLAHFGDLSETATSFLTLYNSRYMRKTDTGEYFTMLLGIIDTRTGELALVQAGHPCPLLMSAGGRDIQCLGEGGFPIGLVEDASYEAVQLTLKRGDRLCVYSDGVTDCENAKHSVFGQQKLKSLFRIMHHQALDQCKQAIYEQVKNWRGLGQPFNDDVSCLILEFNGDSAPIQKLERDDIYVPR
ncbi:PP2C family protein-serine/threonine phosphatase [Methylobacillus flagellatus]|uniref:PP2C family protein-serine/threonine phosphatase n=1 Tax=Methylobacillus flagellatus TaxID=405 RepID=UPI0010FA3377|nr:SpoIIE family protein phosphatase [Methylobacillus flagellatus]